MDSSNIRVGLKVDSRNLRFDSNELSKDLLDSMENSDDELTSQACFQKIYKKQIKTIDSQLNELYPILKPQAKDLYYNRKIELSNVYAAKKKSD